MALFRNNRCAVFTWDPESRFCGVRCDRAGDTTRIRAFWQAQRKSGQSNAQLLQMGRAALDVDPDTTVIVGGISQKACFIDVTMPKIAPEDLRLALQFELTKFSPIQADELTWGYRIIGKAPEGDLNLVRLVYFREEDWNDWLDASSGLGSGVDMIIPATAALDPVLADTDVGLSEGINGDVFVFRHQDGGRRMISYTSEIPENEQIFGLGKEPLTAGGLQIGGLAELSLEEQSSFAAALILGRYGLSEQFAHDQKNWLPVPLEIRPRRNRFSKIFTLAAAVYVIFVLGMIGSSWGYNNYQKYAAVAAERKQLQAKLESLMVPETTEDLADQLEAEIKEHRTPRLPLMEVLADLTSNASDRMWATALKWDATDGDLRVEFEAEADEPEFIEAVRESSIFEEASYEQKAIRGTDAIGYLLKGRVKYRHAYRVETAMPAQPPPIAPARMNDFAARPPPPPPAGTLGPGPRSRNDQLSRRILKRRASAAAAAAAADDEEAQANGEGEAEETDGGQSDVDNAMQEAESTEEAAPAANSEERYE